MSRMSLLLLIGVLLLSLSCSPQFSSATVNTVSRQLLQQQKQQSWWQSKQRISTEPDRTSSVIFPLAGNVYPDGIYYAALNIGNPPKPYFLDVDTGSDLTWVQCDAPCVNCAKGPHPLYKPRSNQLVLCEHPLCTYMQLTGYAYNCKDDSDQCDYEIEYAGDESSMGVLVSDFFTLQFTNRSILHPNLAFGCGYDQQGWSTSGFSPTDGVLGLGLGESGILSQLQKQGLVRSVLGHCLSKKGGGFLFLGDTLIPRSGITWTPMFSSSFGKYYSPGAASLFYGKQYLIPRDFKVVFDSGSSYTYFADHNYQMLTTALAKQLHGKPLKAANEDGTLPLCWKGNKPFRSVSDYKRYFNSLVLSFGKRAVLEIPPEGYLITTKYGNTCLGILNGTEAGLENINLIGDISMQDLLVIYDNERGRIGWARANCNKNNKLK